MLSVDIGLKLLYFTASFPPPFFGGSVGYIYNIVSNLPSGTAVVHTANINPQDAMKFDKTFPHRIIRSSFIRHVQEVVVHDQNQNKIHC